MLSRIRLLILTAVLAAASLLASCSASSDRYIDSPASPAPASSEPAEPQPSEPADASASDKPAPSASPAASPAADSTASTEPAPSPSASASPSASPSPAPVKKKAEPPKAATSKKDNESVNKAAAGSILNKSDSSAADASAGSAELSKSVEEARAQVKQLKQDVEEQDDAKIRSTAAKLKAAWTSVEPDARASYAEAAALIQEKMDGLDELIGADTLDYDSLLRLDYELYQTFRQLADQAAPR
ncbi:hypothetical protein ACTHPH_01970 [Paenibacillus pasadenensis]|uniref:Uncharacterized protein n=1 Tax=Paenibacillus pasadenensis TaxID=217090 RepID=A0A2N5N8C3_9BACL|nr:MULTISPECIES: hypothetical protein [Paenibacillus]PLT46573.1 hypothetical protein B8V81_0797 [Paenibacillus pasadenensis]QGG56968.1 hypothetical protein GE073_16175 [Paenibacillus sp. B01]